MKYRLLILALALSLSLPLVAEPIDKRAAMPENGRLEVSNTEGSVHVKGWDRKEIEVTGELDSEYDELEFEVNGSDAYININHKSDRKKWRSNGRHRHSHGSADLIIRVPVSTRLNINTVSADIKVENISESQRLQAVSADIVTSLRGREGIIKSVSGELEVRANGRQERVVMTTVSGDIDARGVSGELEVTSVSGDLDIEAGRISRLDSHTVSGDLELVADLAKGGSIDIETVSGDVELHLASLYDTEFHLESFNGDILPIFDQKSRRKSRYAPGSFLRFSEGSASSRIRVETLNGDIDVIPTGSTKRPPNIVRKSKAGYSDEEDFDEAMDNFSRDMDKFGDRLEDNIERRLDDSDSRD